MKIRTCIFWVAFEMLAVTRQANSAIITNYLYDFPDFSYGYWPQYSLSVNQSPCCWWAGCVNCSSRSFSPRS